MLWQSVIWKLKVVSLFRLTEAVWWGITCKSSLLIFNDSGYCAQRPFTSLQANCSIGGEKEGCIWIWESWHCRQYTQKSDSFMETGIVITERFDLPIQKLVFFVSKIHDTSFMLLVVRIERRHCSSALNGRCAGRRVKSYKITNGAGYPLGCMGRHGWAVRRGGSRSWRGGKLYSVQSCSQRIEESAVTGAGEQI